MSFCVAEVFFSFFEEEENYIQEMYRSLINNPEYYAVTRRITTKRIQWPFKKKYNNCPRKRIKAVKKWRGKRIKASCPKAAVFLKWIHFFPQDFHSRKRIPTDSRNMRKKKKKKEKKTRAKKKARVLRDPRTRHPSIYITSSTPAPFLRNSLLS